MKNKSNKVFTRFVNLGQNTAFVEILEQAKGGFKFKITTEMPNLVLESVIYNTFDQCKANLYQRLKYLSYGAVQ